MKKLMFSVSLVQILVLSLIMFALYSCGPKLKSDGSFASEEFIGKFHGISIYMVEAPNGTDLYIGINESGNVTSTQYSTGGKTPSIHRLIVIDGKSVTKEEAKKLLEDE
jgi:uncharacterized lipoprotein YehR (DUF1307 family)